MAKKRRFEQLQAAASTTQEKKIYVNPLQQHVDERLADVEKKLEGRGKTILYGIGALVVIGILAFVFLKWSRSSDAAAQAALGKAIETAQTQVSDSDNAPDPTVKTFKSEKERAEAAIADFQAVADKFGGAVGEKARYFIATNRLYTDRPTAITELEGMANTSSEVGKLSKFALAQTRVEDNRLDEAVALYQELLGLTDPVIAKDTIKLELAKTYEKQNKTKEAADLYYEIAKAASDAKDPDGKGIPFTQTATDAKDKLKKLDPERSKEIVEPTPDAPAGGSMPINIPPQ
jgi:predicted negative regulator of RcsB-dependent stress response